MIIYDQHPEFVEWICRELDCEIKDCTTITQAVDGQIEAVTIFWNQRYDDVELAIAARSPKWGSRKYIKAVFEYVFYQLGLARATALVDEDNQRSIKMLERLGFIREGVIRKANKGKDVIIYGMLKEECRWIKGRNNG
jgi:RimJ/RimL family protein N-acetyltransferase